ncbi:MAG: TIM barrel protein [Bacteroidota bacterium]
MTIFVSTIAFKNKSIDEIISLAKRHGLKLEFSSGIPTDKGQKEAYLTSSIPRLLHNYFPPPDVPFVLNLASQDKVIRRKSINHCKQGLSLAKESGSKYYSAHAGFCGDPKPEELGSRIDFTPNFDRELYWDTFKNSILEILQFADQLGIDFLIENNVCAKFNLTKINENPLLCAHPQEIIAFFKQVDHQRVGLLLDTGHLKVSGHTLGFDVNNGVAEMWPNIKALHHSDNDGLKDSNEKIDNNYWFLPYIKRLKKVTHVLEVKNLDMNAINEQLGILTSEIGK